MSGFKRCFKCGAVKKLANFYRHQMMADGHLNKCKECCKAAEHARRKLKEDEIRAYDRGRANLPHRVEARKQYQQTERGALALSKGKKAFDARSPFKKYATVSLNNALRDGKIKRLPCLFCGDHAEAHHPSYALPYAVVWLCDSHHKQVHKEHRERIRNMKNKSC